MAEFERLLNENDNDNPNYFPFKWEVQYWGDKVMQEESSEEPLPTLHETVLHKNPKRGNRRKQDFHKAISKRKTDNNVRNIGCLWYNNLHQYSKNKIHCSCPMCAFNYKKHGQAVYKRESISHGDMMRLEDIKEQIRDYNTFDITRSA